MPDSTAQLASNALRLIGADPITALTDDSARARVMDGLFIPTLDAKIQEHNWNFAQRRVALAELADTPVWGYAHQFQLPQDPFCLQVLETNLETNEAWRVETFATVTASYRVLVTDASSVSILYLARITDPTLYPALFGRAFEYELAYLASYALSRNAQLRDLLFRDKEMAWQKAKSRDGQEARMLKKLNSTTFTDVR
jgi:hypothetical protein